MGILVEEAGDAAEDANRLIEQAVEAAKPKPALAPTPMERPTTVKDVQKPFVQAPKVATPEKFRPRRQIVASKSATKPFLETQADVDEYLAALRKELESAIAENARVEIA